MSVPEGPENNKGNVYMSKTSPPKVLEAYSKQFHRDFITFLHLRSKEIIPGEQMVLTFAGTSLQDPTYSQFEMEAQTYIRQSSGRFEKAEKEHPCECGLVKEADIDSFNIPFYTPYRDEVEAIIQKEGSFNLQSLKVLEETVEGVRNHNENECLSDKQKIRGTFSAKLISSWRL
ncbi:unnamed protein product [Ilex paraguariensis]|uniref:Uncharacterized protein n=1 Tax=Ilex paraguariensis TaxID=185542 RepID=A0ABC8RJE1_9AQUA